MKDKNMTKKTKEDEELKQTRFKNRIGPPYSAVTIDTCIYRRHHYRFDSGLLVTLGKLQVPFVVSEITYQEIIAHLHQKKNKILDKIISVNDFAEEWYLLNTDEKQQVSILKETVQEISPARKWDDFLALVKAEVVNSEHCDIPDVLEAYFNSKPPFNKLKKKNEFPDAIALFSLEKWAIEKGVKILAISSDDNWLDFSEESDYIDVISHLETGLAEIKPLVNQAKEWIYEFISKITTEKYQYSKKIDTFIREQVHMNHGKIDENKSRSTHGKIKGEVLSIGYNELSLTFSADEIDLGLEVIINTPKSTLFTINGEITVSAEAEIVHYERSYHDTIYDYNDRILSDPDTTTVDDVQIPVKLLFLLNGNITSKGYSPNIDEISILNNLEIPFGEVLLPISNRLNTYDDEPD